MRVERSILVDVPAKEAYAGWSRFQEFPNLREGPAVRRPGDSRLSGTAGTDTKRKRWYTRVRQTPYRAIAWKSSAGTTYSSVVTFRELEQARTEVRLRLDYEPEDLGEEPGDAPGGVGRRIEGDLQRFKGLIEGQSSEAGARRGSAGAGGNQPALRHGVSSETAMAHCRDYETRGLYGASGQGGSGYGGTSEGSTSPGTPGLPSTGLRT